MNRHKTFEQMLARREDLTIAEDERLRDHLAGCEACRSTAEQYAPHPAILSPLRHYHVPRDLMPALLATASQPRPQPIPGHPRWRPKLTARVPVIALIAALMALSGLAGGGIALKTVGATSSTANPNDPVKYWCVAHETSSTEMYLEKAPVPGMKCFDNPADAQKTFYRTIGLDPNIVKGAENGTVPQSPGTSANGQTCTASLSPGGSKFQIAYAKCAGGRMVIAFHSPPKANGSP